MSDTPGILLVNLGSPDAPTAKAVRRYLHQFLRDRHVVDTSPWIWLPILHGVILRFRPAKSAKSYQKIWHLPEGETPEDFAGQEAPLVRITRAQVAGVQARLGDVAHVQTAMRYGNPSIAAGLSTLKAKGCTRIGIVPLYPQYAGATTATVYDEVRRVVAAMEGVKIDFINDYYDDPRFIGALASGLEAHLGTLDWTPDVVLTSYHGLPQSHVDKGDPYQAQCIATTEKLRSHLGQSETQMPLSFQSRFGPKDWLKPYTDDVLADLAGQGVKNIAVMMPGFAADCLETTEEIAMEARETFLSHGGENFSAVPCLNDDAAHLDFLTELIREKLL